MRNQLTFFLLTVLSGILVLTSMTIQQSGTVPIAIYAPQAWQATPLNDLPIQQNEETYKLLQSGNIDIKAVSLPIADEMLYHHLSVTANKQELFSDTTNLFTNQQGLLPIMRQLPDRNYEILLGMAQGYDHNLVLRLITNEKEVLQRDTLPMFENSIADADGDTAVEFAGFLDKPILYCQNCDSTYYNPMMIYEVSSHGFRFDNIATYDWIMANYGVFYGFKPQNDLVVPLQHPNKNLHFKEVNI